MPSATLLVLKPFYELQKRGEVTFDFSVGLERSKPESIGAADMIVVLRGTTLGDLKTLRMAERMGKSLIYEIDDNFHAISMGFPLARRLRDSLAIGVLDQFFARSNLVRVYSPAMKDAVEEKGGNASLERLYFDLPQHLADLPVTDNTQPISILFASARHGSETEEAAMMAAIENVLRQRDDGSVRAVFWKHPPKSLAKLPKVEVRNPVVSYSDYLDQLASLRPAIGLAPLGDDLFYRSKTNNKYREYGGLGISAVYSNADLYAAAVKDGKNGLLAGSSVEEWQIAIERLIDDPELRNLISTTAHRDVAENYTFEAYLNRWRKLLPTPSDDTVTAEHEAPPVITLAGQLRKHAPLSTLLCDIVHALGGRFLPETGEQSGTSSIVVARDEQLPSENNKSSLTVVDLSLCGAKTAERWIGADVVAIALAGSEASEIPEVLSLPHPRSTEGLYDSSGAAAQLLGIAEQLLDTSCEARLPTLSHLKSLRVELAILPVRVNRITRRIAFALEGVDVSALPGLIRDKIIYRIESRRHLRAVRRDEQA